ncbi:MAG: tetratricopeptide repeat protein [Betaproteobacteria bacterium]
MPSSAEQVATAARLMQAGDAAAARVAASGALADATLGAPQRVAALRVRARAAEALHDLATAFADLDAVTALVPGDARSWAELGTLHAVTGNPSRAAEVFRHALDLDAGQARTWNNLGSALWNLGSLPEAAAAFGRATTLDPDYAHAFANLGTALRDMGKTEDAERALERAIAINPRQVNALTALASIRQRNDRLADAIKLYALAAKHSPADAEVCIQLGRALAEADDLAGARRVFDEGARRDPSVLRAQMGRHLLLPNIYVDAADVERARADYAAGLGVLERELPIAAVKLDAEARLDRLRWSNFLLAYQGDDDKPLQQRYATLMATLLAGAAPAAALPARAPRNGRKLRVGFVSSFFRDGTVGRYFASWITGLDRARFEIIVYHLHASDDKLVGELRAASDAFRAMPRRTPSEIARTIRADAPDVLVYPELGMDATSFILAALRLAPLQCAGWGHPVTTGHPTIDVFFSSDAMEPADGESHYSERLVRLPGIGTRYRMPIAPAPADVSRAALGLPEDRALFLCPQSLFKIHPRDDALFVDVLARNPRATLVLFSGLNPYITTRFHTRFDRALQAAGIAPEGRVIWLPGMRHDQYLRVNAVCDAMLDTTRWSGGNTSLDAIAAGLPIVTLPGRFMRARQSAGMLRLMGVDGLIAANADDYLAIAARIADDRPWRDQQAAMIRDHRARIFDDPAPVSALAAAIEENAR